jgi:hypothetical protein
VASIVHKKRHVVLARSSSSTNFDFNPRFAGSLNRSGAKPKVSDLPAVARRKPIVSNRKFSPEHKI